VRVTRFVHLDLIGGVAGDMLLAALLDAGADAAAVFTSLASVTIEHRGPRLETVSRGGIRALHLVGTPGTGQSPRRLADIMAIIRRGDLPDALVARAAGVFGRLVEAEARVHDQPPSEVLLHEAGDDDAIFDVVGVLLAIDSLEVDTVTASPVPLGGGRAPGGMIWPGPATLELLRGVPTTGPPPDGEATTPTGAALVAELTTTFGGAPSMTLVATGYGAGSREMPGFPNLVRALVGTAPEATEPRWEVERALCVVEANIDDQSPQLVADAAEALFSAGAIDVWQTPIQMKRGRLAVTLSALVQPPALDAVKAVFFVTTTTLGVRIHTVDRAVLRRDHETLELRGGSVRIKRGRLGDLVVTTMPEHNDLEILARATGIPVRRLWQEALDAYRRSDDAPPED
jgi:uncharacterized protein (TIGR00299 family) protein